MAYSPFTKPYLNGWADGSEGNTPVTANILNNNYDAYLTGVDDWISANGLVINPEETPLMYSDLRTIKQNNTFYKVADVEGNPELPLGVTIPDLEALKINSNYYKIPEGGSGGVDELSELTDVNISSPSNGQVLKYNSTSSKWENANESGGSSWTDVTGTLTAGATSITLSDASITSSSTIDIYTDLDVPYNSKSLSTGSITITFDAQSSNMSVKVRVS